MNRKTCSEDGCQLKARNKGLDRNGKTKFGRLCQKHHKFKDLSKVKWQGKSFDNSKCHRCGWDKAPCDRHRINDRLGYTPENVIILCPNCHREEHYRV